MYIYNLFATSCSSARSISTLCYKCSHRYSESKQNLDAFDIAYLQVHRTTTIFRVKLNLLLHFTQSNEEILRRREGVHSYLANLYYMLISLIDCGALKEETSYQTTCQRHVILFPERSVARRSFTNFLICQRRCVC